MDSKNEVDGEAVGDEVRVSFFSVTPSVGTFIIDNFAIGLTVQYESTSIVDISSSQLLAGPFIKYYFGTSNINPFFKGAYLLGNLKDGSGQNEEKLSLSAFDIGFGFACFINEYVSFDFGLLYGNATITTDENYKLQNVTSGIGFEAGFAVCF